MSRLKLGVMMLFAVVTLPAYAGETVVLQKDKTFTSSDGKAVKELKVKVGDSIDFRNEDPFFHNVFSLSDTKSFDLGSYPKGQSRKVNFDKPGTVEVECSIHSEMQLKVEVSK